MNKIDKIDLKIKLLEEKKKALSKYAVPEERKKYIKLLIETGKLTEKYFGIEHLSIKDREELFSIFADYIKTNAPKKFDIK